MKNIYAWSLIILLIGSPEAIGQSSDPIETPPALNEDLRAQDPEAVLLSIDQRVDALGPLRYGAIRTTERAGARTVERWSFVQGQKGSFRVDYSGDTARQIAYNGRILTDYVPALRAARQYDMPELSEQGRQEILTAIGKHVFVPGVRVGVAAAQMTWQWDESAQAAPDAESLKAVGRDAQGGVLTVTLDAKKHHILRTDLRVNERFLVSVEGQDHVEVQPGVWFPTRVELITTDESGEVRVNFSLTRWTANVTTNDSMFSLSLDKSVSIEKYP